MESVGVRTLRNESAAIIRRAAAGERIIITVDGVPSAQIGPIEPPDHHHHTLNDLIARGWLEAPRRGDRPEPSVTLPMWAGVRLDHLIRDVRGR